MNYRHVKIFIFILCASYFQIIFYVNCVNDIFHKKLLSGKIVNIYIYKISDKCVILIYFQGRVNFYITFIRHISTFLQVISPKSINPQQIF